MGTGRTHHEVEVPRSPSRPPVLHPFHVLRLSRHRVASVAAARAFARPYRDVAGRLAHWEATGDLLREPEPVLYLHEYESQGLTVRGVVGALDLTTRSSSLDQSAVLPHEAVHPEQADSLARKMHEMRLNPAPILLAHRGTPESRQALDRVAADPAAHTFQDRAGQRHRLWPITRPELVDSLHRGFAAGPLLIADGHHRYSAYLRLQEEHGQAWDRGLAMVVDQEDTPLFLGAVHRVLHGVDLAAVADAARAAGVALRLTTQAEAMMSLAPGNFVATDGATALLIRTETLTGHRSPVEDLHQRVLPRLVPAPTAITYHHAVENALESRDQGTALLLPAPSFDLVDRTLRDGRLLPEKATSFQPKPSLGVLMRAVEPA